MNYFKIFFITLVLFVFIPVTFLSAASTEQVGGVLNGGELGAQPGVGVITRMDIDNKPVVFSGITLEDLSTKFFLQKFNGTSWESIADPIYSVPGNAGLNFVIDSLGNKYLSINNSSASEISIFKLNENTSQWVLLGEEIEDFDIGASFAYLNIDKENNLYFSYTKKNGEDERVRKNLKFNSSENVWEQFGQDIEGDEDRLFIRYSDIFFDETNTPFIAVGTIDGITIKKFEAGTWVDYITTLDEEMLLVSNGKKEGSRIILAGTTSNQNVATVKTFDGSVWDTKTFPSEIVGNFVFREIYFDSNGNPFFLLMTMTVDDTNITIKSFFTQFKNGEFTDPIELITDRDEDYFLTYSYGIMLDNSGSKAYFVRGGTAEDFSSKEQYAFQLILNDIPDDNNENEDDDQEENEIPPQQSKPKRTVLGITYGCKDQSALNFNLFSSHKQELCQYTQTGVQTTPSSKFTFARNLTTGMNGEDVLALQKLLNTKGFTIAQNGAGSPGNETNFFGSLTKAALAKFQAANSISPAIGYFGPITRAFVNSF